MTQRAHVSTSLPSWLKARERTQTTPDFPLELRLRPMTSLSRRKGVAGVHGLEKAHVRVAEVRHRVVGDVVHGLAECDVEDEEVVEGRRAMAQGRGDGRCAVDGVALAGEREVEGCVGLRDGARRGVHQAVPQRVVVEEVAVGRPRDQGAHRATGPPRAAGSSRRARGSGARP